MKITDIRAMKLRGSRCHGVGGETDGEIVKIIIRVDTDAGVYGLGEVDNFMDVSEAIAYIREYFRGRDVFATNALVSELLYGTLPPYPAGARHGIMERGIIACPASSPTATPWGPVAWGVSGVEMALCDLAGKALQTLLFSRRQYVVGRIQPFIHDGHSLRDHGRVILFAICFTCQRWPARAKTALMYCGVWRRGRAGWIHKRCCQFQPQYRRFAL